jgi:hypothetical protein
MVRTSLDSYAAISAYDLNYENQTRFVVNSNKVFIQYSPFFLETYTTASRPDMSSGFDYGGSVYDFDLKIPIWWNGTTWTDALGTAV